MSTSVETTAVKDGDPIAGLNKQLADTSLIDTKLPQDDKAATLLLDQMDPDTFRAAIGEMVVEEKDRKRLRDAAQVWTDAERRNQFLKDARIDPDEDVGDMWAATEAWLNHSKNPIPERLIEYVDEAVKKVMPPGAEVTSITPHGISSWSRSAYIETLEDGETKRYFLKATPSISGKIMFQGEHESLKAITEAVPDLAPKPFGWGTYESDPDIHFFLSGFVDMLDEPPDPQLLPEKIADMHKKAVASDGLYGFHVPTTAGLLPVKVAKGASWEDYYRRYLKYLFRAEQLAQGAPEDPVEYQRLVDVILNRVIPRLLRPLETGGREIVPRLLHTDLWHGNCGVDIEGRPIIYDPCSLYGHNELELGVWSCPRTSFGPQFINKYHTFFERSAPVEDHDRRHHLYLLAFEARAAVTIVGIKHYRNEMLRHMAELDNEVPETYEEWAKAHGEEICPPKARGW